MEISEYENIEIFNKTQRFTINKCENQILSQYQVITMFGIKLVKMVFQPVS
jgi:hypothetical protein